MLTTGRLHFSSTLLHLLTESVLVKQMEKITTLSDKTEKLQNWQTKASFAVEDEVNCLIRNYYEALGYAVAPLAPGARSAGLAMLSPKIPVTGKPVQHLYSFDAAYQLTKEDEELVVLGEVRVFPLNHVGHLITRHHLLRCTNEACPSSRWWNRMRVTTRLLIPFGRVTG